MKVDQYESSHKEQIPPKYTGSKEYHFTSFVVVEQGRITMKKPSYKKRVIIKENELVFYPRSISFNDLSIYHIIA